MRYDNVLKTLKEAETHKLKEGYSWDAARYAFFRYALMFLSEIAESVKGKKRKKRKPTNWNLFVGEYLRQGKTIKMLQEIGRRNNNVF